MLQKIKNDPQSMVKFGLSANFFIFFFIWSMICLYLPKILDFNGFNSAEIGELRAYSYAIGVVAPIAYAQLAQKFGRRLLLRIGFFLSILLTIPLFYKFNFWTMNLLIMVQYFFILGTYNQFDTLAINTLEDKNYYGTIRALGSVGFVIFAVSAGWLADQFGLLNLIWYLVALQIIAVIVMFIMPCDKHVVNAKVQIPENEETTEPQPTEHKFKFTLSFVLLIIYVVLEVMGQGIYNNFFIIYATKDLGYSNTVASIILSTGVAFEIIGLLASVFILRLVNINLLLIGSGVFSALRWYVQGFIGDSFILLLLTQTLHMFTFSFLHVSVLKFINDNFKNSKDVNTAIGLYGSIGMGLGGVIGSVIAGYTWDLSPQTAYSYSIAFSLTGGILAIFIRQPESIKIIEEDDIIEHDLEEHLNDNPQNHN